MATLSIIKLNVYKFDFIFLYFATNFLDLVDSVKRCHIYGLWHRAYCQLCLCIFIVHQQFEQIFINGHAVFFSIFISFFFFCSPRFVHLRSFACCAFFFVLVLWRNTFTFAVLKLTSLPFLCVVIAMSPATFIVHVSRYH